MIWIHVAYLIDFVVLVISNPHEEGGVCWRWEHSEFFWETRLCCLLQTITLCVHRHDL